MKSLQDILKQDAVYLNGFKSKIDVIAQFDDIYISHEEYHGKMPSYRNELAFNKTKDEMTQAIEKWSGVNILFASYGNDNYSGEAFVLFEKDGKLYEVNASHCSCYGLEGQFDPEETTIGILSNKLLNGSFGVDCYCGNEFSSELKEFLGI